MSIPNLNGQAVKTNIQNNIDIYKQEIRIAIIGAIAVMCLGIGVFFMQPFPELLEVKIWGFPFPYWYQLTFNWLGMALLAYVISNALKKNEEARENAKKED